MMTVPVAAVYHRVLTSHGKTPAEFIAPTPAIQKLRPRCRFDQLALLATRLENRGQLADMDSRSQILTAKRISNKVMTTSLRRPRSDEPPSRADLQI